MKYGSNIFSAAPSTRIAASAKNKSEALKVICFFINFKSSFAVSPTGDILLSLSETALALVPFAEI